MPVRETIIQMLEEIRPAALSGGHCHLYQDLGLDSLSFIRFLLQIEDVYRITFGIGEMEACLELDYLISLVERKRKEKNLASNAAE